MHYDKIKSAQNSKSITTKLNMRKKSQANSVNFKILTYIYGIGEKFWGYVRTNAESLCVEFCAMQYNCKRFNLLNNVKKVDGLVLSSTIIIVVVVVAYWYVIPSSLISSLRLWPVILEPVTAMRKYFFRLSSSMCSSNVKFM
jgi:hypothetical protein